MEAASRGDLPAPQQVLRGGEKPWILKDLMRSGTPDDPRVLRLSMRTSLPLSRSCPHSQLRWADAMVFTVLSDSPESRQIKSVVFQSGGERQGCRKSELAASQRSEV